jgi:hypothetical protein
MTLKATHLLALIPLGCLAATGAVGTQLALLGLTLAIFFGTLSFRRPTPGEATTTNSSH